LQKLERTVSPNLNASGKQQLGGYLETIRGKIEENTRGCKRMAGIIKQVREQHKKVDTGYLVAYHEKIQECARDANQATQKARVYLNSFNEGPQGTNLQQVNLAAGSLAGYLESHVGQMLQLIDRIRVPAKPNESLPPRVLQLGGAPIIIQGLAQNNMFIQQLDDNRAVISSHPLLEPIQPLRVANGV
jgi:hypothetical protein